MAKPIILTLIVVLALLVAPLASKALDAVSAGFRPKSNADEEYPIPPGSTTFRTFLPIVMYPSPDDCPECVAGP